MNTAITGGQEEDARKAAYTLYWRNGVREVIDCNPGDDINTAMTNAGYDGRALNALDFYYPGVDHGYSWHPQDKCWFGIV